MILPQKFDMNFNRGATSPLHFSLKNTSGDVELFMVSYNYDLPVWDAHKQWQATKDTLNQIRVTTYSIMSLRRRLSVDLGPFQNIWVLFLLRMAGCLSR